MNLRQMTGKRKIPCEKHQQADHPLEGLDTRGYALYFSEPFGLGGSGRGLIDILSEKLGDGKRIHINGLGYFSVSIGSTESENPKKMTRGTVQITGVNFQPEKSFKKSIISRAHFVRERYKVHTVDLSPIEVDGLLSEYFKDHRSITCARMQQVCGMTRSTAYRRLQALTQGAHPSLQREGYKNATAYIPVKGHYGRSYTADRW